MIKILPGLIKPEHSKATSIKCEVSAFLVISVFTLDAEILSRTAHKIICYYLGFPFRLKKPTFEEWECGSVIPLQVLEADK